MKQHAQRIYEKVEFVGAPRSDVVEFNVDLGFGIVSRQRFRLADYDVPQITGGNHTMGLAAQFRLNEILTDERVEDTTIAVSVDQDGQQWCQVNLLIADNDCSKSWHNLVHGVLIREGWGVMLKGASSLRHSFKAGAYPIEVQ